MTQDRLVFHVPTRPYTPIDALNRRAAALGSPRYAELASTADYNGHHVSVQWNEYGRYYIAEYYWAGRVVLDRGTFAECLRAALAEHGRGALGASVSVCPRQDDEEALALCRRTEALVEGPAPREPDWYTWRHRCAAMSARDSANPGAPTLRFDWELMQASETEEYYLLALREKYGSEYEGFGRRLRIAGAE